jgi:hypothetical protein
MQLQGCTLCTYGISAGRWERESLQKVALNAQARVRRAAVCTVLGKRCAGRVAAAVHLSLAVAVLLYSGCTAVELQQHAVGPLCACASGVAAVTVWQQISLYTHHPRNKGISLFKARTIAVPGCNSYMS